MRPFARVLIGVLLLLGLAGVAAAGEAQRHVVHLDQRFQTIDHFAASDAWTTKIFADWSEAGRRRVADLLFSPDKGIGLSMWRFNLGAGFQPERIANRLRTTETFEVGAGRYDWDRLSAERWMLAAARERGVGKFLLFCNSAPARMTVSGSGSAAPGPNSTNLKQGMEEEYAKYLGDVLEHFAKNPVERERIAFDWVSIFNEPQWEWDQHRQEGTRASNEDIKRVVRQLHPMLRERGLATEIFVPESGSIPDMYQPHRQMTEKYGTLFGNYVDSFCGDESVNGMIGKVIGYHSYWSDSDGLVRHREALRRKMEAYPGWGLWQSEYCVMNRGKDLGMTTALNVGRVIHLDLSVAGVSGWGWWLAVSTSNYKDGLLYTDWKRKGDEERVEVSKTFWALGHFSRFVRPGMTRVAVEGVEQKTDGLMATAYTDGKRVVVVYVNYGEREAAVQVGVSGGTAGVVHQQAHVTTEAERDDLRAMPVAAAGEEVVVPARSLVTVVLW